MWRPENWGNPYAPADYPSGVVSAYEAGADAMLEALRRGGTAERQLGRDGWLVFIPDEEADMK